MNLLHNTITLLICICIIFSQTVLAAFDESDRKETRRKYYDQWMAGNHKSLIPLLKDYLKADPRLDVTYWLATSLCQTNQSEKGKTILLELMKHESALSVRDILRTEFNRCGWNNYSPSELPSNVFGSTGSGWDPKSSSKRLLRSRFQFDEIISRRLVEINNPDLAIANFRTLLKNRKAEILQIEKHFVLACISCKQSSENFKTTVIELERYITYFSQEFGLKRPQHFISIYAVGIGNESILENEHGIRLSSDLVTSSTINGNSSAFIATNYSLLNDLSIVFHANNSDAWINERLRHQLFHLLNKDGSNFDPPWIEEGMATLFENSTFEGELLLVKRDKREELLRQKWATRPRIKDLIRYEWSDFVDIEFPISHDPNRIVVPQAMAKYFMLYLKSKGKIKEIFKSMKSIEITDDYEIKVPDAEEVLKRALSMKSIDDIDRDFVNWFSSLKSKTDTTLQVN